MTFSVYAIQNQSGRIYIGQTMDFANRLLMHNKGVVPSTLADRPWHVLKIEEFATRDHARYFERQLKKSRGKRQKWLLQ
jgi:putative endonuclease